METDRSISGNNSICIGIMFTKI